MPIKVRVVGARGAAFVMAKLSVEIKKGAKGISSQMVMQVASLVMEHDTKHFLTMQRMSENRITLPEAVFTRQINRISGAFNKTIGTIEVKVRRLLPLADTGRLFKSISDIHSPDVRVTVTAEAISIVNLVPYMGKHIKGVSLINLSVFDMYEFGQVEQQRLKERVPPPPPKGKRPGKRKNPDRVHIRFYEYQGGERKVVYDPDTNDMVLRVAGGVKKKIFEEKETGDLKTSRPYYRLKNWAEARYPTIARTPKRNWIYALPPEIVQAISRLVLLDVVERSGK